MMVVKNVCMSFAGVDALAGISFAVDTGETVGLIGPNGSGKSTILNVVTGIYRADRGSVEYGGRSLVGLSPHQVASAGIGRTFQNPRLFESLTVSENIKVAWFWARSLNGSGWLRDGFSNRRSEDSEALIGILSEIGMLEHKDTMAGSLPYGFRKFLQLGMALALGPGLLLLDEPAAGLNEVETRSFRNLLERVIESRKLSALIIEHDMGFIRDICPRVIALDEGKVICDDQPQRVMNNERVISAYLGYSDGSGD